MLGGWLACASARATGVGVGSSSTTPTAEQTVLLAEHADAGVLYTDGYGEESAEWHFVGRPRTRTRGLPAFGFGGDCAALSIVSFAFKAEPSLRPRRNEEAIKAYFFEISTQDQVCCLPSRADALRRLQPVRVCQRTSVFSRTADLRTTQPQAPHAHTGAYAPLIVPSCRHC